MALSPLPLAALQDRPLVSVLVANYNYAPYLPAALQSLLDQTYPDWEAIVVDDGSTDGSREVLAEWAARDARIRVLSQPNGGQASALNAAFGASRGPILSILDSDDVFEPEKLAATVDAFRQWPRAGLHIHAIRSIDAAGDWLGRPTEYTTLPTGWQAAEAAAEGGLLPLPPASALSFRHEVGDLIFPIDVSLRRAADCFVQRCAPFLTEIAATPTALVRYRLHGANLSGVMGETPAGLEKFLGDQRRLWDLQHAFLEAWPDAPPLLPLEESSIYIGSRALLVSLQGAPRSERDPAIDRRLAIEDAQEWRTVAFRVARWLPPMVGAAFMHQLFGPSRLKRMVRWARRHLS